MRSPRLCDVQCGKGSLSAGNFWPLSATKVTDGPNESVPPENSLSAFVGLALHPLVCLLGFCALHVGEGTELQHLVHEAAQVNCPSGSRVNSPIVLS